MVLLGEAFHGCNECLNLSIEGSGLRFISLVIVSGCHRPSKYHETLCLGSGSMAYCFKLFSPQTAPTDDAKNF